MQNVISAARGLNKTVKTKWQNKTKVLLCIYFVIKSGSGWFLVLFNLHTCLSSRLRWLIWTKPYSPVDKVALKMPSFPAFQKSMAGTQKRHRQNTSLNCTVYVTKVMHNCLLAKCWLQKVHENKASVQSYKDYTGKQILFELHKMCTLG